MAISHVHTSPPLLCLLEVHIRSELTFPQVLSYQGRSGRPRGAEQHSWPWGCPGMRLGLSCLTLACTGLSTLWSQLHISPPILRITTALRQRPEVPQTLPLPSVLAVPSLLEKLNFSSKVQIKGCLPGSLSWPTPSHPGPFCGFNYLLFWTHISIKC